MLEYFKQHDPTDKVSSNPSEYHIFNIRYNLKPLLDTKYKVFREFISKGLYLLKQVL